MSDEPERDGDGNILPGQPGNPYGRWKPGQSGNPKGRPKSRPYKDALERMLAAAALQSGIAPDNAHDLVAAAHVARCLTGDMAAIKELADRIDGKVATEIGGSEELGPVQVTWKR